MADELLGLVTTACAFILLVSVLYLLAAILTPWAGMFGRACSHAVLGVMGGGVVLLLLQGAYVGVAFLAGRSLEGTVPQMIGTCFLYFATTLLLGMHAFPLLPTLSWLRPGKAGAFVAHALSESVGAVGTILAGFGALGLALIFYGMSEVPMRWIGGLGELLRNLFRRRGASKGVSIEPVDTVRDEAPVAPMPAVAPLLAALPETEEEPEETPEAESSESPFFDDGGEPLDDELVVPIELQPGGFPLPPEILGSRDEWETPSESEEIRRQGERLVARLAEFQVEAELAETVVGPTVVQFRVRLAPGIKVSRVSGLSSDLALALAVSSLRIEAPIPGKPYVGIEVPNPERKSVSLRSLVESESFRATRAFLPVPIGVTVEGRPLVLPLEDMPHLLVAGTTGSGKSVFISNCLIGLTFLRRPEELRLLLVDPKRVEMALYERMPHLLTPPIADAKKAIHAFAWAIREMERRYEIFARARVRNLKGYNAKVLPKDLLPHVVIVVDEFADLMMTASREVEDYVQRLAQKARATGIHLILATQRPSVNVITGVIKANVPARIAFTLPTQADSRTILDVGGAERLLGRGDMLLLTSRFPKPLRCQAAWIDEGCITTYIERLVGVFGEPQYVQINEQGEVEGGAEDLSVSDPLFRDAVKVVLETGIASASRLQRQLRVGFTRAARMVDSMERLGIVGPQEGAKGREILVDAKRAEEILEEVG